MRSSFAGFYVAKSGIQAAQANLNITGQNMANSNTDGYTRQRVDSSSVGYCGGGSRYASTELSIGGGVNTEKTSQYRDSYLDVRFRVENSKVGETKTQLESLKELNTLYDEIEKNGIESQFKDLTTQLQTYSGNAGDTVMENIVKTSSLQLIQAFNNTATKVSAIRNQQTQSLEKESIGNVNDLLQGIAHINQEIKSSEISGNASLELLDQRNTMLDSLSNYVNIEVSSQNVSIGSGREVSELSVSLVSGNEKFNLIDNNEYKQFSLAKDNGTVTNPVKMVLTDSAGSPVTTTDKGTGVLDGIINDYLSTGSFKASLDMLNGKGSFATGSESTARGIGYYEGLLDNLANTFSGMMNAANSTSVTTDVNGVKTYNKPLFTTNDGTTTKGITAANISLSKAWSNSSTAYITNTKQETQVGVDGKTKNDNILNMINELAKKRTYKTDSGVELFTGSFNESVTNISETLGLQISDVTRQNTTFKSNLTQITKSRGEISSVDINEEGINLIMYNQALTASSRFMTTLDEAMDTIINNMGVIGR